MTEPRSEVTRLVESWGRGEEGAFSHLMELVYDELRDIAHHHLDLGARDEVIDTTVLVHEAYLRLAQVDEWDGQGRAQFFAFCSKAMRHILIDFARRRHAAKRGGRQVRVPLHPDLASVGAAAADLLVVEDALQRLEAKNARMSQVFECRYYGGMSVEETASALKTSTRTVEREWARARAYLCQALEYEGPAGQAAT
jgi:RNA polymerase sigma factor (TIGR02999 family)